VACDEVVETYFEALTFAQERAADLPGETHIKICSIEGAGEIHVEDLSIENGEGLLGGTLEIDFGGTVLCHPNLGWAADRPTLRWQVGTSDIARNLSIDYSNPAACGDAERPGIDVSGSGQLLLEDVHFKHTRSFGLRNGYDGLSAQVHWRSGSSSGSSGPVVQTWGAFRLGRVMVAGARVGGHWGGSALIEAVEPDGSLELYDSIFYANAIDGRSDDTRAMVSGNLLQAHRVTFFENAAFGSPPLLQVHFTATNYERNEDGELLGSGIMLQDLVFSRNRSFSTDSEIPPLPDALPLPPLDQPACAGELLDGSLQALTSPWGKEGAPGKSSLIEFSNESDASSSVVFALVRSSFVQNQNGDAPIISGRVDPQEFPFAVDRNIQIHQCTFADNSSPNILEMSSPSDDFSISTFRNLFLGDVFESNSLPRLGAQLASHIPPRLAFHSMNATTHIGSLHDSPPDIGEAVLGPNFDGTELVFEPNSGFLEQSPCERFQRLCPGADTTTCDEWTSTGKAFVCSDATAGAYLVSASSQAKLDRGRPWPWKTDFFYVEGFEGWAELGAAGWSCLIDRVGLDYSWEMKWGDGDGQPDAIDCDNDDADIFARWPSLDGYSTDECQSPQGSCFVCPSEEEEGPSPAPEDPGLDEPDTDATQGSTQEGCSPESGWGISWSCDGGGAALAILLILTPVLRRQRVQ